MVYAERAHCDYYLALKGKYTPFHLHNHLNTFTRIPTSLLNLPKFQIRKEARSHQIYRRPTKGIQLQGKRSEDLLWGA